MKHERAERVVRMNGHFIGDWIENYPSPGRAYATCKDCLGTIEIRADGSLAGPVAMAVCPMLLRAEAEQREGISDYLTAGDA